MTINRILLGLWVLLFGIGMWLAMHRPLWGDEIYGQKITIEGSSWGRILSGHASNEGNNFPLYYAAQKAITSVLWFSIPDEHGKDFLYVYPRGQIILRLFPDAMMATAIVLLVRFFWRRQGAVVGLMALMSALSSGMVWWYWIEARAYPLWFLLTLWQALLVLELLTEDAGRGPKVYLTVCHWLLVTSAPLGFIQVIIVQTILFCAGQRAMKFHWSAGILPVGLALVFFSRRSTEDLYLGVIPEDIIKYNFSFEAVSLLAFYVLAYLGRQSWVSANRAAVWMGLAQVPYFLAGLLLGLGLIGYVGWRWPVGHDGFPVYARHLLFVSALSVVLIAAMFSDLWSRSRGSVFWRGIFLGLFVVLLTSQFMKGFANAWFQGRFY